MDQRGSPKSNSGKTELCHTVLAHVNKRQGFAAFTPCTMWGSFVILVVHTDPTDLWWHLLCTTSTCFRKKLELLALLIWDCRVTVLQRQWQGTVAAMYMYPPQLESLISVVGLGAMIPPARPTGTEPWVVTSAINFMFGSVYLCYSLWQVSLLNSSRWHLAGETRLQCTTVPTEWQIKMTGLSYKIVI